MDTNNIYNVLFNRIINNQYAHKTWLREEKLAKEFGISRTPMRRVLFQLQQDGLLELIPNRGVRLFTFTADDLEHVIEIRKELELLSLRIGGPSLSIQKLLEIKSKIESIEKSDDFLMHAKLDSEFHDYLIESSRSRRLISMLNQLQRLTQSFREIAFKDEELRQKSIEEHLAIIEELYLRNLSRANELLRIHIDNAKVRILKVVLKGNILTNALKK